MKHLMTAALVALSTLAAAPREQAIDLAAMQIVDLSHAFGSRTLFWPTSPTRFTLEKLAYGRTASGYFYAANAFCTPEHGGTHLDAPIHFSEAGRTAEKIPLEQLVAPAVVIDIVARAAANRDSRATGEDVRQFENQYGQFARGTIFLPRTGWSRHWPDAR